MPRRPSRHRVLALAGGTAASALAGCLTGSGPGSTPEETGTSTARSEPTRSTVDTARSEPTGSNADTARSEGRAETSAANPGVGRSPDCSAFAVEASMDYESYDAAATEDGDDDGNSTRTPTTVELTRDYVVAEVTVEVADPPPLRGVIRKREGDVEVSESLREGTQRFRYGPYGHHAVPEYEFWIEGCRD